MEFEHLVIPLSEKEKRYREHPEESEAYYRDKRYATKGKDGVYLFDKSAGLDLAENKHGNILSGSTQGGECGDLVFNKQTRYARVPLHRHAWLELFYVYAGHCQATINGKKVGMEMGDVCIMDTHAVHAIDPIGQEDVVLTCLMQPEYCHAQFLGRLAGGGTLAQFLSQALEHSNERDQYLLFHTADVPIMRELFENAFCEYLDPGVCGKDMLDSYMNLIFIQLARCYQTTKEKEYQKDSRRYITEVLRYIEQNFATCTLEETAEQFDFHPNYLSRALKKATGASFKDLVDQNRLQQAAFLLRNTVLPISEIAQECGWSNQTQFYKKFVDGYGETPRRYRAQDAGKGKDAYL
jgi:AraC-like DNA-binding protein/mannose-6-phosphate isomerase-like protein (cupin superfamily)